MNILFWMDPICGIDPKKDTTYLLIYGCQIKKLTPYFINSIIIENHKLQVNVQKILPVTLGQPLALANEPITLNEDEIQGIWLRKDPPVNESYMQDLLLLNQFSDRVHMFNNINGILLNNEKLSATQFINYTPNTLISKSKTDIKKFIVKHNLCVLKPLNGYGGQGIFKVTINDTNLDPIIESLTQNELNQIICQKAVDNTTGDKRIILLDGEAIGAVKRINHVGHRNNFMAGGLAEKTEISEEEFRIINEIRQFIKSNDLFFVGIDIIDHHLIEINVTSPTGLQEINLLNKCQLETKIIEKMIQKIGGKNA
ncbi:MAG: YheC/YheD family protein [Candidatus Margulisiibacteriota bacterium]